MAHLLIDYEVISFRDNPGSLQHQSGADSNFFPQFDQTSTLGHGSPCFRAHCIYFHFQPSLPEASTGFSVLAFFIVIIIAGVLATGGYAIFHFKVSIYQTILDSEFQILSE